MLDNDHEPNIINRDLKQLKKDLKRIYRDSCDQIDILMTQIAHYSPETQADLYEKMEIPKFTSYYLKTVETCWTGTVKHFHAVMGFEIKIQPPRNSRKAPVLTSMIAKKTLDDNLHDLKEVREMLDFQKSYKSKPRESPGICLSPNPHVAKPRKEDECDIGHRWGDNRHPDFFTDTRQDDMTDSQEYGGSDLIKEQGSGKYADHDTNGSSSLQETEIASSNFMAKFLAKSGGKGSNHQ